MSYSKKERDEYNRRREHMSKELGLTKNEYNRFRRVGNELHRHGENYANGTTGGSPVYNAKNKILNEYGEKHYNKDVGQSFKKIGKHLKAKGLHAYHQTDPRGAALHLSKKKLNQMNYTRDGHVIY